MKPLDFCMKFNKRINDAIITTIIESVFELYFHGRENPRFEWDNGYDNACSLCDIDFYKSREGKTLPFQEMSNIVISLKDDKLIEEFMFEVIDIFNDRVDLCLEVNATPVFSIPLGSGIEFDDGYVFQLETESPAMPFTLDNLKMLQRIAAQLADEEIM